MRDVRSPQPLARRCVIKGRYFEMNAHGQKAARLHLAYIERDGVERDGSPGRLFDAAGDVDRELFAQPIAGERRQFRFIVSPEDGGELNLRDFTGRLMKLVEEDLGRKLHWAAVTHHDTDNPHVHVVVRGVDAEGRDLVIDKRYLGHGMRDRAREIATNELGLRTVQDHQRQLDIEASKERLTSLDRDLERLLAPEGTLESTALAKSALPRVSRERLLRRLETLEALRLVQRRSGSSWGFSAGWQDALRALGARGDVIKRMHQALKGDPTTYRAFADIPENAVIEGIVRRKGLQDELAADLFAIVETAKGDAYYVRLDDPTAERVEEGDLVRVSNQIDSWVKPTDRVLEQVAAKNAGTYDPRAHLAQLASAPVVIRGRQVPPHEVIQVNVRRLERLARYRLVDRLADGTWRVPPNLVQLLEQRELSHPRRRAQVQRQTLGLDEQTTHPGRTWLDAAAAGPLAPFGFGAAVKRAAAQRADFLRARGIDPASPRRLEALADLERRLADRARGL